MTRLPRILQEAQERAERQGRADAANSNRYRSKLKADAANGPANHPEMVPLSLVIGGGCPVGDILTIRCAVDRELSDEDFAAAFGLEFAGTVRS